MGPLAQPPLGPAPWEARLTPKRLLAALAALLVLLVACTEGSHDTTPTSSPTAVTTPTPSAAPSPSLPGSTSLGGPRFEGDRALAHVQALADGIGSRPTGSDAERRAADYIRDQLASYGYEAQLQPFSFDIFFDAGSTLEALTEAPPSITVFALNPSISGSAEAPLVNAGLGRPEEFPADTAGKIALMERGEITFSDKVANAAAAGAVASLIYNNRSGLFAGQLREPSTIPAASLSQEDGQSLLSLLNAGPLTVRLEVRTQSGLKDSQNVVARPPGGDQCRVVVGGHYDSVAAGPGANDNASGTATVIEIARVLAADGVFDDVCFALFGAEEVGLIGSARYVEALTIEEKEQVKGMLNFDMVGVGSRWFLAGSLALRDLASQEAASLGLDYTVSDAPPAGLGSDQSSFIQGGIPAVFFHRIFSQPADDPRYHTAGDTSAFVEAEGPAMAGQLALAVIGDLLSSP